MTADQAIAELHAAVEDTMSLLKAYGDDAVVPRLAKYELALVLGDRSVIQTLLSEATGSMGSLQDRVLSRANGDPIRADEEVSVNARLWDLVRQIETRARAAQSICRDPAHD